MKLKFVASSFRTTLTAALIATAAPAVNSAELLEDSMSAVTRPLLSRSEILDFLPEIGRFTFPAPYDTEAVRLTNADSCNGSDCVNAVGYSYWRNSNYHVNDSEMLILAGLDKSQGGDGPSLISYNKQTDAVTNLGPLFDDNSPFSWGNTEGWYFSASQATKLYVSDSTTLYRYDVYNRNFDVVFDIRAQMGSQYVLWQHHSSDDDRVHSATVRDSNSYEMLGCLAWEEDSATLNYFPKVGDYDECQVDRSGDWLLIKENVDGRNGEDNRIIDLRSGNERILLDEDGAAGHSDLGHGYMIAADNYANDADTQKLWRFDSAQLTGQVVYSNRDWSTSAPSHVSHTNSVAGVDPASQFACGSSLNSGNGPHANEIICFSLDGSRDTTVVAPVMTDINSTPGGSYMNSPKGNLDVTGQYFIWSSNAGSNRRDLFMVKVSGQTQSPAPRPAPAPAPAPDPAPLPAPVPAPAPLPSLDPDPVVDPTPIVTDTTAPEMVVILATSIGSDSATIKWRTDEPADSQVEFGLGSAYGSTTSRDSSLKEVHEVKLTGLAADSSYSYRVRSSDAAGNETVSGRLQFKTKAGADTTGPAVAIMTPHDGEVVAGYIDLIAEASDDSDIDHVQFMVDGKLIGDPDYDYPYMMSGDTTGLSGDFTISALAVDSLGNRSVSDSITFAIDAPDTQAPMIHSIAISNVSDRSATISWETNEPSENLVAFGPTSAYGANTGLNTEFNLSHSVTLSNLAPGSRQHFQIHVRDSAGNIKSSTNYQFVTATTGSVTTASSVNWVNLQNTVLNGASLSKSGGCDGCADAGAVSSETLSGNGFVELTASVENKLRYIGLSDVNADSSVLNMAFAFALNGGYAEIREFGAYVSDVAIADGDRLRIEVNNGTVTYLKNGMTVHSSSSVADSSLRVSSSLYSVGATLQDVVLGSASTAGNGGSDAPSSPAPVSPVVTGVQAVAWTSLANVVTSASSLTKVTGCNGCGDAGALSSQTLGSDGYFEFTATAGDALRIAGLTSSGNLDAGSYAFALRLQGTVAEVRENGAYRSETGISAGDVLRISVAGGVVSYSVNGNVFYTSAASASQQMQAAVSIFSMNGTIDNAMIRN